MLVHVPAAADGGDCSTSRKACKNCSCGRAEQEAAGVKVTLTQDMLDNPQSSCGNVGAAVAAKSCCRMVMAHCKSCCMHTRLCRMGGKCAAAVPSHAANAAPF
jgi:hypothetical protein